MGDRFLKKQIENFTKGRDRGAKQAAEPRLIDRPEIAKTIYHVQPTDGKECKVGEILVVLAQDPNGPAAVLRGHEQVGTVEGEDVNALKGALSEARGPGIAQLRILSISEISGDAAAEMVIPASH